MFRNVETIFSAAEAEAEFMWRWWLRAAEYAPLVSGLISRRFRSTFFLSFSPAMIQKLEENWIKFYDLL